MKKASLVINIVLAIAVVIIYVLHFSSDETTAEAVKEQTSSGQAQQSDLKIAYLKVDSLLANYDLAVELNEGFTKNQEDYSKEYSDRRTKFEEDATAFQEKLQSGGFLTQERAVQERDRLLSVEEEITNLEQELTAKLNELQSAHSQQLEDSIMSYLRIFNKDRQYAYILDGSNVIIGDEAHNITKEVLDALNTRYNSDED